jgi:hypothetical protein
MFSSPDLTHTRLVKEGDRLPLMVFQGIQEPGLLFAGGTRQ